MKFLMKVMLLIYLIMQTAFAADVIIDAGHGGKDSGAAYRLNGKLHREKDIVRDVAHHVKNHLAKQGYSVMMTRKSDETVSLNARQSQSRQSCEQLFMSIHADAASDPRAKGGTVYVPRYATARNRQVAQTVQRAINPRRSYREKTFNVVHNRNPKCASLLVELGYMSNPNDLAQLSDANYRRQTAEKLAKSVAPYLALKKNVKSQTNSISVKANTVPNSKTSLAGFTQNVINKIATKMKNSETESKLTPRRAQTVKPQPNGLTPQGVKKIS